MKIIWPCRYPKKQYLDQNKPAKSRLCQNVPRSIIWHLGFRRDIFGPLLEILVVSARYIYYPVGDTRQNVRHLLLLRLFVLSCLVDLPVPSNALFTHPIVQYNCEGYHRATVIIFYLYYIWDKRKDDVKSSTAFLEIKSPKNSRMIHILFHPDVTQNLGNEFPR